MSKGQENAFLFRFVLIRLLHVHLSKSLQILPPCFYTSTRGKGKSSYCGLLPHIGEASDNLLRKRQATSEETEAASLDSGLIEGPSASSESDNPTEKGPNADLFNGAVPYPAVLPYPPTNFGAYTPYGRPPYLGFGGVPAFDGFPSGSQPFLGTYRGGHPFHREVHPVGYHGRH